MIEKDDGTHTPVNHPQSSLQELWALVNWWFDRWLSKLSTRQHRQAEIWFGLEWYRRKICCCSNKTRTMKWIMDYFLFHRLKLVATSIANSPRKLCLANQKERMLRELISKLSTLSSHPNQQLSSKWVLDIRAILILARWEWMQLMLCS